MPGKVVAKDDGSFFIGSDWAFTCTIRYVDPKGFINTVAGSGGPSCSTLSGLSGPARKARLGQTLSMTLGLKGELLVADKINNALLSLGGSQPGVMDSDFRVGSEDAAEIYEFDSTGRHLRTYVATTGAVKTSFAYDSAGWLASATDGEGNITQFQRDSNGRPTGILGPFGAQTSLLQDSNGFLQTLALPGGRTYQLEYYPGGLLKTLTNPRGKVSTFTYDVNSRLISDVAADGYKSTLTRTSNGDGYTVSIKSAMNRERSYRVSFPASGDEVHTNTDNAGVQSSIQYKADGSRVETTKDGTTTTSVFAGDSRFGMQAPIEASTTTVLPSGLTSSTARTRTVTLSNQQDPASVTAIVETENLNGKSWTSAFDASLKKFTFTSPSGRLATKIIDAQGRLLTYSAPGMASINYGYDTQGRLLSISQTGDAVTRTSTIEYGANGLASLLRNGAGEETSLAYDAALRLTSQTFQGGATIALAISPTGGLTGLTPPGRAQHVFERSDGDLVTGYLPPSVSGGGSNKIEYAYNLDRQLQSLTLPQGYSITYAYNATSGRLESITVPAGQANAGSYVYAYKPSGQISNISSPAGVSLAFTYDGALLKSEAMTGPVSGTVSFGYDNNLRMTSVGINGSAVTYGYDDDGLLTSAGAASVTRRPDNGWISAVTLGGVVNQYEYNSFGEVGRMWSTFNGNTLYDVSYQRDLAGRINGRQEAVGGAVTNYEYGYDPRGRLASMKQNGVQVATYNYDANGTRTSINGGTVVTDAQDRLLQVGGISYSYSSDGSLASRTETGITRTFSYDAFGNLMATTVPGQAIAYLVDARHRRVGKKVNGTLVQGFLYGDQLEPIAELNASGQVVSRFVYGTRSHVPDYIQKGGVTYSVVADHLGSVRLVVNTADGNIVQRIDYDTWGNVLVDTNPGFQPFGFAGGTYDRDISLVRFGARDYDPQIGRWTTKDPIGFKGGDSNLYAYVGGNPVSHIDPTGLADYLTFNGNTLSGYVSLPPPVDSSLMGLGRSHAWEFSVPATSGPWGAGRLPEGTYGGRNLRQRSDAAMKCPDGNGWSLDLDDKDGRTLLRIHPDGNVPGTLGCVGVMCGYHNQVYGSLRNGLNRPGFRGGSLV